MSSRRSIHWHRDGAPLNSSFILLLSSGFEVFQVVVAAFELEPCLQVRFSADLILHQPKAEPAPLQLERRLGLTFIEVGHLKASRQLKTQRHKRQEFSKGAYMGSSNDTGSFRHYLPPVPSPDSTQPPLLPQPSDSPPPPQSPLPQPSPPPSPPTSPRLLPTPLSLPGSPQLLLAPLSEPPSPVIHTVALESVPDTSHCGSQAAVPNMIEPEDDESVKELDAKWDLAHKHLWASWTSCLDSDD